MAQWLRLRAPNARGQVPAPIKELTHMPHGKAKKKKKDLVPVPDINYEQGAQGVTNLASECSRRFGSLLEGG